MKRLFGVVIVLTLACAQPPPAGDAPHASDDVSTGGGAKYDLVIRGGEVIDGTGAARTRADVGIRGDSIVAIGDLANAEAGVVLDATGRVVAPGFIDLLGNSQAAVLIDPRLEGKIRQGVTTEVTGEGHS
ncbi:MAG TPA: hypothetical protein VF701_14710, partial [Thermoanaerobaculia bacterium]